MTREDALARDAADPLAFTRDRFDFPPDKIYLDGNSLGALPRATAGAIADAISQQWGRGLVGSWADWFGLPARIGAKIAPMIGAGPDEVTIADSTSVNLFKLIAAALAARPGRREIVTEAGDFHTDSYVAHGVAQICDARVTRVAPDRIADALGDDTALLLLTHAHYRTGRVHDMAALTAAAQARGALVLWDLSHSTGAVAVDLNGCKADLATGGGYKYLNGGPGAPAFLYVAKRLHHSLQSPLPGWVGHAEPFAFEADYRPAPGVARFQAGTPSVLGMVALEAGLAAFDGVDLSALYAKGQALGDYCIALMETHCAGRGFTLASPRANRGSHVGFAHEHAWPICRSLIARGVIGDFRAPDMLRLGFAPLYTRFVDVWDAVSAIRDVVDSGAWDAPQFHARAAVT